VALARPHLVDPYFTIRAAGWYGAGDIHCPPQYYAGRDQLFRNSQREREELTALRRKARPGVHASAWRQAAE
jgi:anthraniloyl-CoA monooxygenase